MINKSNWKTVRKYLAYRVEVDQIAEASMRKEETHLRHVLNWAQEASFRHADTIRPTLPVYLLSARLDGENGQLSAGYIKKALATARLFFGWLMDNEAGYKHIKQSWIKTIKARRLANLPRNTEAVTLDEILAIAARPVFTIQERRARAGMVFLFLSGMRIGAFITMPLQAVDIPNRAVYQYPSLGVKTKNGKAAKTFLLDIPELLKIVQIWDDEIRAVLPSTGFWFAPLSPVTGGIDTSAAQVGKHRITLARRDFQNWLKQENLPYHSPHKFRHGHIHYGLEHAKSTADYKAVSMNVMHANMEITDGFYSNLRDDEIQNRISTLGKNGKAATKDDLISTLEDLLSRLKGG